MPVLLVRRRPWTVCRASGCCHPVFNVAVHGRKPLAPRQPQTRFSPRRFPFRALELGTHKERGSHTRENGKHFRRGPAGRPHSHEQLLPPPGRGPGDTLPPSRRRSRSETQSAKKPRPRPRAARPRGADARPRTARVPPRAVSGGIGRGGCSLGTGPGPSTSSSVTSMNVHCSESSRPRAAHVLF